MADVRRPSAFYCMAVAASVVVGLIVLAVRLKTIQIDSAAAYNYRKARQAERRIGTGGLRGRILDRHGAALAENRPSESLVLFVEHFQGRTYGAMTNEIRAAIARLSRVVGRSPSVTDAAVLRHLKRERACPLTLLRNLSADELARFLEHADAFPGFAVDETVDRVYPFGPMAAHVIGHVGRGRGDIQAGDERFDFVENEFRGRGGLESYYDSYLRGMSGEDRVLVDSHGYAIRRWTVVAPKKGPDLKTTLDAALQQAVERELEGCCGACVVVDPRTGDVLAMASAPSYDLNTLVPVFTESHRSALLADPLKPLLNRAAGGSYAPGSTFKPVTALAALAAGVSPRRTVPCTGVFEIGGMRIHCARRWGHGDMDLAQALRESCNPYFCSQGVHVGTNALVRAARAFGLGARTGIDFALDAPGVVPDGVWKEARYGERWYPGDLAQMAMGQGMLLASPLQMALVAGALGTGRLVRPRLNAELDVAWRALPFAPADLDAVREGLRLVVASGSGRRAGEGVPVAVAGKTGTAEVGAGERRRKNAWFIGYAPAEAPEVALALVVERGESGGATAAPRAGAILRSWHDLSR